MGKFSTPEFFLSGSNERKVYHSAHHLTLHRVSSSRQPVAENFLEGRMLREGLDQPGGPVILPREPEPELMLIYINMFSVISRYYQCSLLRS